jgi:hypothetical protein
VDLRRADDVDGLYVHAKSPFIAAGFQGVENVVNELHSVNAGYQPFRTPANRAASTTDFTGDMTARLSDRPVPTPVSRQHERHFGHCALQA